MTRWPFFFTAYLLLHQVWGHDPVTPAHQYVWSVSRANWAAVRCMGLRCKVSQRLGRPTVRALL
jgi:hypothetical protein